MRHHSNLDNGNGLWTTTKMKMYGKRSHSTCKEHWELCDLSPHLTSHPYTPTHAHALNLLLPRMLLPNVQNPWGFLCTLHFLVNKLRFHWLWQSATSTRQSSQSYAYCWLSHVGKHTSTWNVDSELADIVLRQIVWNFGKLPFLCSFLLDVLYKCLK